MSSDKARNLAADDVERIIHRADDNAIAAFNRRRDELGDSTEADALREGFRYGRDHGRAGGVLSERALWETEIARHIATYGREEDRLRQEHGEDAALPYVARALALIDLRDGMKVGVS